MGSKGRSDYTVIGDNVNIASRLEGMTRFYDAQILISSATYEALHKKEYKIRPIDFVEFKGKNKAIEIFEVLCKTKPISEDEQLRYTHALERFRSGDVNDAFRQFTLLQQHYPSKLYHYYVQCCQDCINHPDKEFTSILKMSTK